MSEYTGQDVEFSEPADRVAHSAPADAKIRKYNKDIVLIRI